MVLDTATIRKLPETIPAYLAHRLPEAGNVRVSNLRRAAGGSSRAMWFFSADWEGDAPIARDLAFRADDTTCFRDEYGEGLEREFMTYRALEGTVIPVPRNYWFESDPRWTGEPFVIREVVAGRGRLQDEAPDLQQKVLENFVDLLADQHTLDWRAAGLEFLGPPQDPRDAAVDLLDRWDGYVRRELLQPSPLAAAAVAWLRAHVPAKVDRVSLNQGQVGPGQFLYGEDGRIVAQLDWEQAYLGDPMSDLAYFGFTARPFADGYMDALFRRYSERSGIPVRRENLRWYSVFQTFWGTAHAWTALNRFAMNEHRQVQTLTLGLHVQQMFPRILLGQLAQG